MRGALIAERDADPAGRCSVRRRPEKGAMHPVQRCLRIRPMPRRSWSDYHAMLRKADRPLGAAVQGPSVAMHGADCGIAAGCEGQGQPQELALSLIVARANTGLPKPRSTPVARVTLSPGDRRAPADTNALGRRTLGLTVYPCTRSSEYIAP